MFKTTEEFLSSPAGGRSSGRLVACYLVVIGVIAFPAGLLLPWAASYCSTFSNQCFTYAAIFYGTTKGYDTFNWFKDKIASKLGGTPSPSPAPQKEPQEPQSE